MTATNAAGTGTGTVTFAVEAPLAAPNHRFINAVQPFNVGDTVTGATSHVTGGGAVDTCTAIPDLPAGLEAVVHPAGNRCRITGMPTEGAPETAYTIRATNTAGHSDATYRMRVYQAPNLANQAAAFLTVDTEITTPITFTNNGYGELTGCTGTLPTGLSVAPNTGNTTCEITGEPTVVTAAADYTITASNGSKAANTPFTSSATINITVRAAVTTKPSLADVTGEQSFEIKAAIDPIVFTNSGGAAASCEGTLPAGLEARLTAGGSCEIHGTPTTATASAEYSVKAINGFGEDSATVTIVITAPALPSHADFSAMQVVDNVFGIRLVTTHEAGGGRVDECQMLPYTPAGLRVVVHSDGNRCDISAPRAPAVVAPVPETRFAIRAINVSGHDDAALTLTVLTPPILANIADALSFAVGTQVAVVFANTGGGDLTSCAGTLPAGLSFAPTQGNSSCRVIGVPTTVTAAADYTVTATNALTIGRTGTDTATVNIAITAAPSNVDADGDGLIEIYNLTQLHHIHWNLAGSSYKTNRDDTGVATGCPLVSTVPTCTGYELANDLDFDADGDGSTWTRASDGALVLDSGDSHSTYFSVHVGVGGWTAIGSCGVDGCGDDTATTDTDESANDTPFTGTFEGNGYTIRGLAVLRSNPRLVGLFGVTSGATIRNVGLVDNLAAARSDRAAIGGLVGVALGESSIIGSHATGLSSAGTGAGSHVGGLVGTVNNSYVVASFSTATVDASGSAGSVEVGGLVGRMEHADARIHASYAGGTVTGSDDGSDKVGGLLGHLVTGQIRGSYAIGNASVAGGTGSEVGGLVGTKAAGVLVAVYSTGDVSNVAGTGNLAGRLAGSDAGLTNTGAWGFGAATGGTAGYAGSGSRPTGVEEASGLTATNAGRAWNQGISQTAGVWDFAGDGEDRRPLLAYADYDEGGTVYHCADAASPPDDARIIPNCGSLLPVIVASSEMDDSGVVTVISGRDGTAHAVAVASGADAPATIKGATLGNSGVTASVSMAVTAGDKVDITVTGQLAPTTAYDVYVVVEVGGVLGPVTRVSLTTTLLRPRLADITAEPTYLTGTAIPDPGILFTNSGGAELTGCDIEPALPTGLFVAPNIGNTTCEIGGTATASMGKTEYTVTATNLGGESEGTVTFTVNPPAPTLASVTEQQVLRTGVAATVTFANSGGGDLTGCTVSPNTLPTGLAVAVASNGDDCEISGIATAVATAVEYTVTGVNPTDDSDATVTLSVIDPATAADVDGDGLIDIETLAELNNIRYNLAGDSYKTSASGDGNSIGCPSSGGCFGYELLNDLSFDADGDGSTWTRAANGTITLDADDDVDAYFDVDTGGWVPIADNSTFSTSSRFTATFEGNGHTITGLATVRALANIGLFGWVSGAEIRNLGLVDNLARCTQTSGDGAVGGLAGYTAGSTITASWATGEADCSTTTGDVYVGGLVGWQLQDTIIASWTSGRVEGKGNVGGLVGLVENSNIVASFASGDVSGSAGADNVGGLVGRTEHANARINASYASGDATSGSSGQRRRGGRPGGPDGERPGSRQLRQRRRGCNRGDGHRCGRPCRHQDGRGACRRLFQRRGQQCRRHRQHGRQTHRHQYRRHQCRRLGLRPHQRRGRGRLCRQ